MLWRMIGYCCDFNRSYRVVQVPHTCCWTEGPSTLKVLFRQRVRWGRGLIQHVMRHRRMLLNPHYRRLGMITFPYCFIFEFLAPIIEFVGLLTLLYLLPGFLLQKSGKVRAEHLSSVSAISARSQLMP